MLKHLAFFIILLPLGSFAQFTISGRVLSQASTQPVADASVFLSHATIGDKTAASGTFSLQNVKPGKYELVISIIGYENYGQEVTVTNSNINLPDITILPKIIGLKEVTVKPKSDNNRGVRFDLFKDQFLGPSDFARECKILNPELLDFDYDDATTILTASSVDFLEIENAALGYRIKYLLTSFTFNTSTKEIHYEGPVLFTEMTGTPKQQHRWQENRKLAYRGSMTHFLRSAMNDRLEEDGFKVLRLAIYANPERPADDLIDAAIKKFAVKKSAPGYNADSLSYWKKKADLPKMLSKLMSLPLAKENILTSTGQPGLFALGGGSGGLVVNYNKAHHFADTRSLADLINLNYILNKPDNKELTLLSFEAPTLFDSNGWIINPNSLTLKGVLGTNRVAELLPVNYEAPQNAVVPADNLITNIESKADAYTASHVTERVHLHFDRPWYGLGDTIWFKAYTVAGADHHLSNLSGVLYTELLSEKDSVLNRLTLSLDSGTSHGDFALPITYKSGAYRLRAYTRLMLNDSAKFYDQKVIIGGIGPQNGLTVAADTKSDSPANNLQQKEQSNPDVQFFPEGGDLVNGLRCKVALKAINREGQAENIRGTITDQDGNEVVPFSTQYLGMGQFAFTPQQGKQYKAKVVCADGSDFTVDLPKAKDDGFTLTINNSVDSIYVKVAANDHFYKNNPNNAFYLVAQCGGKCYYTAAGKLANQVFTTTLNKTRFQTGIVRFTLFSQHGEPLNERIVFVQNSDQLKLSLSSAKQNYATMEKVRIDLDAARADGKTDNGRFSVAVTDETKVPLDEAAEPTIFTDLLLTSELKGNIENPNYYFINQDDKTRSDLDLLMLTQGYRRFDWKQALSNSNSAIATKPETVLSLAGTITTLSGKPVANGKIQLTSIKDHFSADTVSDINGNFNFTNLYFGDTTKVIINAKKITGGSNVKITIKQPSYPAVNRVADINYLNAGLPEPVLAALKKAYTAGQQQFSKSAIQLKEVKIKSNRNLYFNPIYSDNMKFSANLNGPGNADQVVLADQLTRGGGGRLSDILPSKIFGLAWLNGIPRSLRATHIRESGSKLVPPAMALFVEGVQVSMSELDDINPYDIYSIEVLTSISHLSIYGSNAPNGALIITLKHGADPVDVTKIAVDGLITYKFNGFYKACEFYSPKYTSTTAQIADDRKTIYWNPNIITDANGKASFEYFNAGSPGIYRVVIEGIDGDGTLGRQVFRYKVE